MTDNRQQGPARPRRGRRVAFAAAAGLGLGLLAAGPAAANTTIGEYPLTTQSSCVPQAKRCFAVGKVTGFMVQVGGRRNQYRVPRSGRIVSWGLTVGKPAKKDIAFFDKTFAPNPSARLAVVRELKSKRGTYRLVGQSGTVQLKPFFGMQPAFGISSPIRVRRGDMIALSVITWAPAFKVNLADSYAWRADRARRDCEKVTQGSAHTKRNSKKRYQCLFRQARLLYHAELDPS